MPQASPGYPPAPARTLPPARSVGGSAYALLLDRKGGGREISWQQVRRWTPEEGILWLVGRPDGEETQRWLRIESGIDPEAVRRLLRTDNRPTCLSQKGEGLVLSLRGGGLGPDPQPELLCANIWADPNRVVVLRPAAVLAFSTIRADLKNQQGPLSTGELLVEVIQGWTSRIEQILFGIDRAVDDMEDHVLMDPDADLQQELTSLRQRMIHLGRHLAPQAEALFALQRERSPWLEAEHRDRIREENHRAHQFVAELDSSREQAALIQDEIRHSQSRKLNETMKIVAVFTAYLMPITAITGLLGTNLEGIPGQAGGEYPWAFSLEVVALLGVMAVSYFIFKKKKWFD